MLYLPLILFPYFMPEGIYYTSCFPVKYNLWQRYFEIILQLYFILLTEAEGGEHLFQKLMIYCCELYLFIFPAISI